MSLPEVLNFTETQKNGVGKLERGLFGELMGREDKLFWVNPFESFWGRVEDFWGGGEKC